MLGGPRHLPWSVVSGARFAECAYGFRHRNGILDAVAVNGLLAGHSGRSRVSLYAVLDTEEMVARCQKGDSAAFRQLFTRHRSEVARLVFRMIGPRAELEDIIQEVFLQV